MKLLDKMGLTPKIKFKEIYYDLQIDLIKRLIFCLLMIACGVFFLISTGMYKEGALILTVILIYTLMEVYSMLKLMSGKYLSVVGECIEVTDDKVLKFSKSSLSIRVPMDDGTDKVLTVPNNHKSKYRAGNKLIVFYDPDTIIQKNNDTLTVTNPLFVGISKN